MTLRELQQQVLQLPTGEKWQLVQSLLESLQQESKRKPTKGNLLRLRGIAKLLAKETVANPQESYIDYLTQKYQLRDRQSS